MAAILRSHWATLLAAGLVIFVPVGLLETVDADLQATAGDATGALDALEVIAVALLHTAGALFGEIVFAGLISALATEGTTPVGLRALVAELPIGRLILADFAFVGAVTAGFAALIVPGIVFLVWFSLVGPALEVEHLGVRGAFRRSRQLARTRPWLIAGFVLPISFAEGAVTNLIQDASLWSLGDTFWGHWIAGAAAALVASTLLALAVTVLYLELSAAERPSPRTPPRGRRRSRPGTPA